VSGILGNLFAILKAIARFIVAALETIVRLLKFIVQ